MRMSNRATQMQTACEIGLAACALLLFAPTASTAQLGPEWVAVYDTTLTNGSAGYALAVDREGNVYVHGLGKIYCYVGDWGESWCGTNWDLTIKYSPAGDTLWARNSSGRDISPDLNSPVVPPPVVDASGNVYVTGPRTTKYGPDGTVVWQQPWGLQIDVDTSGNCYVVGGDRQPEHVIKYTPSGDTAWLRPAGSAPYTMQITVADNGDVYFCHRSGDGGIETGKYSTDGDTLWVDTYGSPWDYGSYMPRIALDADGNVYVARTTHSDSVSCIGIEYASGLEIIKYAPSGERLWVTRTECASCRDMAVDSAGYVYVTGPGNQNYLTLKYSPNGDSVWTRRWDDIEWWRPNGVAVDRSGNVYVTGNGGTVKYSPDGDTTWARIYQYVGFFVAWDVVADASGSAYVVGMSGSGSLAHPFDCVTLKYSDPVGDLDCDGMMTISDVVLLGNYIDGVIDLTGTCGVGQADVDEDGDIDEDDYNTLFDIISGSGL